jgi:hypothetical protein
MRRGLLRHKIGDGKGRPAASVRRRLGSSSSR